MAYVEPVIAMDLKWINRSLIVYVLIGIGFVLCVVFCCKRMRNTDKYAADPDASNKSPRNKSDRVNS